MTDTPHSAPAITSGTARARLIEAGLDVFGAYGYTAATTRMIAEQGQVNLAAIPYHFGGKEGLYLAVIKHIVTTVNRQLAPFLKDVQHRLEQGDLSSSKAMELMTELLGVLVDFVVGSPEAPRFSCIVLREQMSPSAAFDRIYAEIMQPIQSAAAALLGVIAGGQIAPRVLRLRAFALVGQVMAFRSGRETLVRLAGLDGYSPEETSEIRSIILEQTRAALACLYPATEAD